MGGLLIQLGVFALLAIVGYWFRSDALATAARFALAGAPVWLAIHLVFKQIGRVNAEALESQELRRAREAGAIFELDDEALLIEQNRLRWLLRWMVPGVGVLLSLYFLLGQFIAWGWSIETAFTPGGLSRTQQPALVMWFAVFCGFASFLYSRYTIGLARMAEWRLLHAGASLLAGNALICLILVLALMASHALAWAEPAAACIVRILLIVLGLEFAINLVLEVYRPRAIALGLSRPAFDSRLLGLITEPGGIAKSIADALNYQFGFEVSRTWFYRLLERWCLPLLACTVVVVLGLTSIVVVDADEEAMIERFGRRVTPADSPLKPGLHLKWPYPIDVVYRAPVQRVQEFVIGEASEKQPGEVEEKPILWTDQHEYVPELMLLVASPPNQVTLLTEPALSGQETVAGKSVSVSLLMVSVPIQYRIRDLAAYLYTYRDPADLLEAVAYQYLSEYAASVDIDELMGPGRTQFNSDFHQRLQARVDELGMGTEIAFVGIGSAHPQARGDVAMSFQSVISAETRMGALVHAAQGKAQQILTNTAGSIERAIALDEAIRTRDRMRDDPSAKSEELAVAQQRLRDLLVGNPARNIAPPSGEAASMVSKAQALASAQMSAASAKAHLFKAELSAYGAAPRLYKIRKYLEVYQDLDLVRKFLYVGNPDQLLIQYESQEQAGLDQILSEAVERESGK